MIILGIESSCDECSLAIVKEGGDLIHQVTATQIATHNKFSGIVPELASRLHVEWIDSVYHRLLKESRIKLNQIDAIAVTYRPGLLGSLSVGLNFAKGLALAANKRFIGIDHLKAHLYSAFIQTNTPTCTPTYPYLGLILSGGHSFFAQVNDYDSYHIIGSTLDDACGEAFDKIAKHFHLGFPGGKIIDELAQKGNPLAYRFPKIKLKYKHPYHFSYSGLKTAVIYQREQFYTLPVLSHRKEKIEDILASFQKAAIDMVLMKIALFQKKNNLPKIVLGGGVACNSYLRQSLQERYPHSVLIPDAHLCTDNAAMVAGLAYHYLKDGKTDDWDLSPYSHAHFK